MDNYLQQTVDTILADAESESFTIASIVEYIPHDDYGLKFLIKPDDAVDVWQLAEIFRDACPGGYAADPKFERLEDGVFYVTIFPD